MRSMMGRAPKFSNTRQRLALRRLITFHHGARCFEGTFQLRSTSPPPPASGRRSPSRTAASSTELRAVPPGKEPSPCQHQNISSESKPWVALAHRQPQLRRDASFAASALLSLEPQRLGTSRPHQRHSLQCSFVLPGKVLRFMQRFPHCRIATTRSHATRVRSAR